MFLLKCKAPGALGKCLNPLKSCCDNKLLLVHLCDQLSESHGATWETLVKSFYTSMGNAITRLHLQLWSYGSFTAEWAGENNNCCGHTYVGGTRQSQSAAPHASVVRAIHRCYRSFCDRVHCCPTASVMWCSKCVWLFLGRDTRYSNNIKGRN